jgi:hypothetical protein
MQKSALLLHAQKQVMLTRNINWNLTADVADIADYGCMANRHRSLRWSLSLCNKSSRTHAEFLINKSVCIVSQATRDLNLWTLINTLQHHALHQLKLLYGKV